ncbi:hypothetical protein FDENT_6626 [Fusarium denticulatum]|uniref:Clr5 domain-containing protein n=1 Tax=Fusarium denticulatum TaxID=48507 RepID=A0A8H5U9K9_9HYPO|nr:hypothetical protein FDENT_6626 [Fusarium denticulatum]
MSRVILLALSFELAFFGIAAFSFAPNQSEQKIPIRHPWKRSIIQQLYLDQNMTREEVLSHLQGVHGFSLSTNQFSKATKRWGFYKQPRQVRTNVKPPESIAEEEAPNQLNSQEELFDFEPDVLDTIDETEACSETGIENSIDSQILEHVQSQFSYTGRNLASELPPSLNHSQPQAMDVDFPCDAVPFGTDKSLPESSKGQLEKLKNARKLETGSHSSSSKTFAKVFHDNRINNKLRVDYLTCCYLFQEALHCLDKSGNGLGKRDHCVPRSNMHKLFAPYRREKDKLLASPTISLDMWSILCLIKPYKAGTLDDLLDRLDTNDLQFTDALEACLGLCEKWIELAVKGLPKGALQFDSLLLHQNASESIKNTCRPLREQSRSDGWQEAGYLFAFVWSNEQREAANSWSWLKEAEISGLSPTHFLATMSRIIVHQAARKSLDFGTISGRSRKRMSMKYEP